MPTACNMQRTADRRTARYSGGERRWCSTRSQASAPWRRAYAFALGVCMSVREFGCVCMRACGSIVRVLCVEAHKPPHYPSTSRPQHSQDVAVLCSRGTQVTHRSLRLHAVLWKGAGLRRVLTPSCDCILVEQGPAAAVPAVDVDHRLCCTHDPLPLCPVPPRCHAPLGIGSTGVPSSASSSATVFAMTSPSTMRDAQPIGDARSASPVCCGRTNGASCRRTPRVSGPLRSRTTVRPVGRQAGSVFVGASVGGWVRAIGHGLAARAGGMGQGRDDGRQRSALRRGLTSLDCGGVGASDGGGTAGEPLRLDGTADEWQPDDTSRLVE